MLTARQLFGFLRSEQAQEASSERTIERIQDSITDIQDAYKQQDQQTKAFSVFTVITTAFLPLSFCTSVGCPLPMISVFSNKKRYQYFGMNNIKEFNNTFISLDKFWLITGLVSGLITLISIGVIWGSALKAKFSQDSLVNLRKKIDDLESQKRPKSKTRKWHWGGQQVGKTAQQTPSAR